jgi:hypothetical protein
VRPSFFVEYVAAVKAAAWGAGVAAAGLLALPAEATGPRELALMTLPRAALGVDAAGLPLAPGSGVLTNQDSAADSLGEITAAGLARIGRITGYVRDYDAGLQPAPRAGGGLLEVKTRVELYRNRAAAAKGLAFWRGFDRRFGTTKSGALSMGITEFPLVGLGEEVFAAEFTLKVDGKPQVHEVDVLFRTGELLASLSVAAAERGTLRGQARTVARRLQAQIARVRAGKTGGS